MGQELRLRGLVPDLIISSTAERARTTAQLAAAAAGTADAVIETRELYLTDVSHQLETLANAVGDGVATAMIVGHNPTLEDLTEQLTGEDLRLTTGNLVRINLDIESWSDLPQASGSLGFVLRPDELPPLSS